MTVNKPDDDVDNNCWLRCYWLVLLVFMSLLLMMLMLTCWCKFYISLVVVLPICRMNDAEAAQLFFASHYIILCSGCYCCYCCWCWCYSIVVILILYQCFILIESWRKIAKRHVELCNSEIQYVAHATAFIVANWWHLHWDVTGEYSDILQKLILFSI